MHARIRPLFLLSLAAVLLGAAPKLPGTDVSSHLTINTLVGPMRHVVRFAPMPDIAPELLAQCPVHHGSFAIDINSISGIADDVRVVKSTGCPVVDQQIIGTLRHWSFRPHALRKVVVPVDFDYNKNRSG